MLPLVDLPLLGSVTAYAIIRTAYVFVALWLTVRLSERQGIRASTMLSAFALGVPAGILGAHVFDMFEILGPARRAPRRAQPDRQFDLRRVSSSSCRSSGSARGRRGSLPCPFSTPALPRWRSVRR